MLTAEECRKRAEKLDAAQVALRAWADVLEWRDLLAKWDNDTEIGSWEFGSGLRAWEPTEEVTALIRAQLPSLAADAVNRMRERAQRIIYAAGLKVTL